MRRHRQRFLELGAAALGVLVAIPVQADQPVGCTTIGYPRISAVDLDFRTRPDPAGVASWTLTVRGQPQRGQAFVRTLSPSPGPFPDPKVGPVYRARLAAPIAPRRGESIGCEARYAPPPQGSGEPGYNPGGNGPGPKPPASGGKVKAR